LVESGSAGRIADLARRLRNLHWLVAETGEPIDAALAESLAPAADLEELGMERHGGSGGRFRQRPRWRATEATLDAIDAAVNRLRPELDDAVADLFSTR
jgi:hypothetical protein